MLLSTFASERSVNEMQRYEFFLIFLGFISKKVEDTFKTHVDASGGCSFTFSSRRLSPSK